MKNTSANADPDFKVEEFLEIVFCDLTFHNAPILKLLTQRGQFLQTNKTDKVEEVNQKLQQFFANKEKR